MAISCGKFDRMTLLQHIRVGENIHRSVHTCTSIVEIEYLGLKCAGKKILDELLAQQGSFPEMVIHIDRFEKECRLLSQVRHPNIVQFLGVHFQQGVRAPILVMEFLPTNLTSCIEQYGILPKEISYSILHDVALGLCYLHSQIPPIIHRALVSNNILLTSNMTAKISDLGSARVLAEQQQGDERDIKIRYEEGHAFMPPEVMKARPYDIYIDEFSYGVMMIHILSGKWPNPLSVPIRINPDGTMTAVTEPERREVFLRAIGDDHPLMDLILQCIANYPQARPHVTKIVERLAEMVRLFPATIADRLEVLSLAENINFLPESDQP